jgi:hypothetical protein
MRALLLASLLTSTFAAAGLPPLSVDLGYSTQVFTARGFDLVNVNDNLHQFRVGAGTGFALPLGALDLELALATGGTRGTTHGVVPVDFSMLGLQLAASWRVPVTTWFHPYAQLGGGYDWVTLTLFDERRLTQTVGRFSGTGLLGVQLAVRLGPARQDRLPVLFFDLGLGATLRQAPSFDAMGPQAPTKPPPDAIATSTVNLGSVPLSGFTARALIGVRY